MGSDGKRYDIAVIGGGLAGVVALAYARRAGLEAIVLEEEGTLRDKLKVASLMARRVPR